MIFWFSGTGNSAFVAQRLAEQLGEKLVSVGDALVGQHYDYALQSCERLGFVFPTYCWGPAPVVLKLMEQLHVQGLDEGTYCFMVTTCGDDVGLSVPIFGKAVERLGGQLKAAFSVQMPNNYVCLPGFDVDPQLLRDEKLHAAPARIEQVGHTIAEGHVTVDVVPGRWAWAKSHIVRPWFLRHMMTDAKFRVDDQLCTHCGKCARVCPLHNVAPGDADRLPHWHGQCATCLACLHHCPAGAINWGKASEGKGRYCFGH